MSDNNTNTSLGELEFGDSKEIWDVTFDDMRKHPIWIDCMLLSLIGAADDNEDGPLGGTEASTRPLLNSHNVIPAFRHANILLKVMDSEMWATATYNAVARNITTIFVYKPNGTRVEWNPNDPWFTFESVPAIDGASRIRFAIDPNDASTAIQLPQN